MKHFLVAGGNGFIGRNLVTELLNSGCAVTSVDNHITSSDSVANSFAIENKAKPFAQVKADIISLGAPEFTLALSTPQASNLIAGSATSPTSRLESNEFIKKLLASESQFGPFSGIFNMASPASPVDFAKMPDFILQTAAVGHRNLLQLGLERDIPVLFASSSEVYGDALVHPQPETYFGNVNPNGHRSCYDEAKRYGEALSFAWKRQYGSQIRIARIFNTYGPGMRATDGRIIPNFFIQALQNQSLTVYGEGQQTRSFCYVADLVAGLIKLMSSDISQPLNLGSVFEHTVLDVASQINTLTGNSAPLKYLALPENDPKLRQPDLTLTKKLLGWQPEIPLSQGLRSSLKYFKDELAASHGKPIETPNV
jgi:dTDP-glucose 4,6-dehydratase